MIKFERYTLPNGLRLLVHEDHTTPMAAINVLYDVGAKDEDPERTGFAHLFEHLMFGGSVNIPEYDKPLQLVGAQNNAFTNTDITNYYITLPAANLETAFWLESDRMLSLAFSEKSLEVQRKVVVEEFKQRYLNQPYGELWLELRPLAYEQHSYQWATIGKSIKHIEEANLEDVKTFFKKHYQPQHAILVVAGGVNTAEVLALTEKWFGNIPSGERYERKLTEEPKQTKARTKYITRAVPQDAIYRTYKMAGKKNSDYYLADLLSDTLSSGSSSRFNQEIIKNKAVFSSIDAYISGEIEPGLFVIGGKLLPGVSIAEGEATIEECLNRFLTDGFYPNELNKLRNKFETTYRFQELSVLNKAMNLAYFELLGDAQLYNTEIDRYLAPNENDIQAYAKQLLVADQCSTLYYQAQPEK